MYPLYSVTEAEGAAPVWDVGEGKREMVEPHHGFSGFCREVACVTSSQISVTEDSPTSVSGKYTPTERGSAGRSSKYFLIANTVYCTGIVYYEKTTIKLWGACWQLMQHIQEFEPHRHEWLSYSYVSVHV